MWWGSGTKLKKGRLTKQEAGLAVVTAATLISLTEGASVSLTWGFSLKLGITQRTNQNTGSQAHLRDPVSRSELVLQPR